MFGLGPMEIMIVGVIAVLLFGKRLPEVAKSMGKSFTEFKKGVRGIEDEIHSTSYSAPSTSSYSNKYAVADEREEATAPKFEPPKAEPQTVESSSTSQA